MCQPGLGTCAEHCAMRTSHPPLGHSSEVTLHHHLARSFVFPHPLECVSIAQSTLALYHLWFCFIFISILSVALGGPVLAAVTCRLCGSDLIWRECRRSIGKPAGEWEFLCSLAGTQATYPTPAAPGLSSLGHFLSWSTCTSHPKLHLRS